MAKPFDPMMGATFIREARKENGITQKQLAEMTGFSTQKISHIECGARTIQFEDMHTLAYALRIDVGSLALAAANIHPSAYLTYIFLSMAEHHAEAVETYRGLQTN